MRPPHKPKQLRIALPWPNAALSPNSRCHWGAKSRAVKKARSDARIAATAAIRSTGWKPCRSAMVRIAFIVTDNRRRDSDNALSSMKAAIDGLADAGVVVNDSWFHYAPIQFIKGEGVPKHVQIIVEAIA